MSTKSLEDKVLHGAEWTASTLGRYSWRGLCVAVGMALATAGYRLIRDKF